MGEVRVSGPRYQQVAVDIAAKIASRQYQVGERIYARSSPVPTPSRRRPPGGPSVFWPI